MSASRNYCLVAESDNRCGGVHAWVQDCGDPQDESYNVMSEMFQDIDRKYAVRSGNSGVVMAKARLDTRSEFVNLDENAFNRVRGFRAHSRGSVLIEHGAESKAKFRAAVADKLSVGFRLNGLNRGSWASFRLKGLLDCEFAGPVVSLSGPTASISQGDERSKRWARISFEPPDFDQRILLHADGEYQLELDYNVEIGVATSWADAFSIESEMEFLPAD